MIISEYLIKTIHFFNKSSSLVISIGSMTEEEGSRLSAGYLFKTLYERLIKDLECDSTHDPLRSEENRRAFRFKLFFKEWRE